jgi:AmmeMemoRadiSam system protein B
LPVKLRKKMIRKMMLPEGWYPQSASEVDLYLSGYPAETECPVRTVIAPHAGWFFSGRIAGRALSSLRRDAGTVIVAGGHLPAAAHVLFAEEDAVCTPLGEIAMDSELRALVKTSFCGAGLHCAPDNYPDNTVEVLLPAVRRLFPEARLLWLRLGADIKAAEAGRLIARAALSLGRNVVLAGSTDLTHYGPAYNFCPRGRGKAALDWVKTVNDRRFIEVVISGAAASGTDSAAAMILERAVTEKSACSVGAVLCALGFDSEIRNAEGRAKTPPAALLAYSTSADVPGAQSGENTASFVGYAAIAF